MLASLLCICLLATAALCASLPIVDVGYARYQAANISDKSYYTFSNIRYAAAPVGAFRWRLPQPPLVNRMSIIQTSLDNNIICPQANEAWYRNSSSFLSDYLGPFAPVLDPGPLLLDPSDPTPVLDPRTSEDCLFLDVFSPKQILDHNRRAPVLFWIHGGGYSAGSKDAWTFTPDGLYNVSQSGFVAVSINYRLGAFGFLGGTVAKEQGALNLGLLDQQFALRWVQKNIHKFGGDPSKVTIMGQSAGGGSVIHHITAYGGAREAPFIQAIAQSPAWLPMLTPDIQNKNTQAFLSYLNVTTLEEGRKASSIDVIRANLLVIGNALPFPSFPFGAVVDDSFIPAPPADLLASGRYTRGLRVFTGHTFDEGLLFTNPIAGIDDEHYTQWIKDLYPSATSDALKKLLELYPATFDGSLPYTSGITRVSLTLGDIVINGNAAAIASAKLHDASFGYFFNVYPATHGLDLYYSFYTPESPAASIIANVSIAKALQKGLTSFVLTGTPDFGNGPLPPYGAKGRLLHLSNSTIVGGNDPAVNPRTAWWTEGGLLTNSD
ncbi:carboxylesterase family protein-like protein [Flagelloscypha sp. PMI_526]|nr:carboxylesterase family protein-like protein [Flagelloscypha sp. PMI_526]